MKASGDSLKSLEKRFLDFLIDSQICENETDNIRLSEKLREIVDGWLNPNEIVSIDKEQIEELKSVLDKYRYIFEDGNTSKFVLDTFKFERMGTSIDFEQVKEESMSKIYNLKKDLEEFFFVSLSRVDLMVSLFHSRFKNSNCAPVYFFEDLEGTFDEFADVMGSFVGYSPKEIAHFCSQERMQVYGLIK